MHKKSQIVHELGANYQIFSIKCDSYAEIQRRGRKMTEIFNLVFLTNVVSKCGFMLKFVQYMNS